MTHSRWRRRIGRPGALGILAGVLLAMAACSRGGGVIPAERHIPLARGGTHSGDWQSMDADMIYHYTTKDQAPGKIRVSGSVSPRFRVAQLRISIQFLDADGRVLASEQVYSSGYRRGSVGGEFKRVLDIPEGALALAFRSHAKPHRGHR